MGPSINNVRNQEGEGVKIPSEMYESLHGYLCTLEWFKNPVSSQTDKLCAGTNFSDYLGLKHCKVKVKGWLIGFKVLVHTILYPLQ